VSLQRAVTEKESIQDLAVFGGVPAFVEMLHVGRPNLGNREMLMKRVNELLDRRWFTNDGPLVREFEERICDYLGVRRCVAICNGTVALEITARALGLAGEVIVPAFTFVATAHALQWQRITPVFCDIDPTTHSIDVTRIEELITPRTSAIVGVHIWGRPCDTDALADIADRHGIQLLYDAAHAFGCEHQGRMIGNFGRAEILSFHATKFVNSFEGGAVVTNDDDLADRMVLMRNFGFQGYDKVNYIGTNGKLTEVAAAMGLTSLESADEFVERNRENYFTYDGLLADVNGLRFMADRSTEKRNYQYVVLEVDETVAGISRDDILRILHGENVLARRYFYPCVHRMEPYRSYLPETSVLLGESERVAERVLVMPTGSTVSPATIASICGLLRFAMKHGERITELLAETEPIALEPKGLVSAGPTELAAPKP